MNASSVFKQLSVASAIIGVLALACAVFAQMSGELDTFRGLLLTGLIAVLFGLFWNVLVRDVKAVAGKREALLFMVMFWTLTPLIAAPAFWSSGVATDWIGAYFEAVSNLTTTGSTIGDSIQSDSIRLWRAALQMVGGLYSVLMATFVLAALNTGGPGIQKSHFLTVNRDDLFEGYFRIGSTIIGIYAGLAVIGALGLAVAGMTPINAITRAVAAVTTSTPLRGVDDAYSGTYLAIAVTSVLLLVGATNIALVAEIIRRNGTLKLARDPEFLAFAFGIALLGAGMCLMRGSYDTFLFLEALSFISTSGMDVTGIGGVMERLPQPIPNLIAFIGGAALSTAGGYKIARVLVLFNRAGSEFRRLSFAHALSPLRYKGRAQSDSIIMGVWVYFVAYLGLTAILALGLALNGIDLSSSYSASIGAISNVGVLVDDVVHDQAPNNLTLIMLSTGCILGRLEVLVIAPLFTLDFWRR